MSQAIKLFDTHAHLHDPWIGDDLPDVLDRAAEAGVGRIVTIGCSLEDSRNALRVADQYERVWATLGVHPHDAKDWTTEIESEFRTMAKHEKVVAIGEIGLDFYRNLSPHDDQYRAFEAQLALADDLNLPVVIHSRDAHEESYRVLEQWTGSISPLARRGEMSRSDRGGSAQGREHPNGVIHCFSGDAELAQRYVELGFMISFAGPITYPKNHDLRAASAAIPLESIVIETDCPYLSPQPRRGKRNEPANVEFTAKQVAESRGAKLEKIADQLVANGLSLFRL